MSENYQQPDERGYFGGFGGRYVAETLMPAVLELAGAYEKVRNDPEFSKELQRLFTDYAGRPTPLFLASRITKKLGGAKIYLKREDLTHTGAHKINNTLGQVLLAKWMGKTKVIAETGAGQHGVATATAAALFGMECKVFMGVEDVSRQAPNVTRMKLLGAEVVPVESGTDPQRRHERGHAFLGGSGSGHLLCDRLCCRSPSLSCDGPGFSTGHRR